MQDIIPPYQVVRGSLRPVPRTQPLPNRRPSFEIFYRRERRRTITVIVEPAPMTRPIESLSPAEKLSVMERALARAQAEVARERRRRLDMKRFSIILVTVLLVLTTGYASLDTIITNNNVKAETAQDTTPRVTDEVASSPAGEGKDETPPSSQHLGNYTVAPGLPRYLSIDKLGINARVLPMSVTNSGAIQAPRNIFDAGWYSGSVKPGEIGAMFIDGHASGPTHEGLFAYLDTLAQGDQLQIEKGDGTQLIYQVVHIETVPLAELDMKKALLPYGNTLRGLNLMTCTGKWLADQQTFDHRVLVYTKQI